MLFGIDIVWLVFGALIIALLGLIWVWWGITHRGPSIQLEIEHRRAGYRGWEDDNSVPSPRYDIILRWTVIGIGLISAVSCGLGAHLMSKMNQSPDVATVSIPTTLFESMPTITPTIFAISTADREIAIITHTPIPTETPTATNTPRATRTPRMTEQATLDGTATPYPTYTPYPTLTPHLLIVTPVDQRPTSAPYVPQAQQSSYGRVVPDQRGQQQQQVYQQPPQQYYQQPQYQYVYPTAQYIIPSWESYITFTPVPSATMRPTTAPTQTPYFIVVTNTPMPTITETPTDVPTQTPYIIVVTNTPTETPTPTPTATFEPSPTPIPPTDAPTSEPTATETPIDEEIIPDEPTDDP
jgi:hypothetical protein